MEWIRESGLPTSPICLTNTYSVGVVHDAMIGWSLDHVPDVPAWSLPVARGALRWEDAEGGRFAVPRERST